MVMVMVMVRNSQSVGYSHCQGQAQSVSCSRRQVHDDSHSQVEYFRKYTSLSLKMNSLARGTRIKKHTHYISVSRHVRGGPKDRARNRPAGQPPAS